LADLSAGRILREYFPEKGIHNMSMKNLFYWLLLPMVSLGLSIAHAAEPGNVRIEFVHPERFTDFKIQGQNEISSVPIFRDEISAYLSPLVAKRFPGKTLTLRFTDIDLAGRLEPWRIRKFDNVRFDRDLQSPLRLYFDYTLTDSKGTVLAGSKQSILDQDYLHRYINYPNSLKVETLFYEKVSLANWVRKLPPSGSALARN
jgi:Protein of unknown function (DUF3016)